MKLKNRAFSVLTRLSKRSPLFRRVINFTGLSLGSTAFIMSGNVCPCCGSSACATSIGAAFFISLFLGGLIFFFGKTKTAVITLLRILKIKQELDRNNKQCN